MPDLDDLNRRAIEKLLPFRGTLTGGEREHLESALREDPALREELDFTEALRAGAKAAEPEASDDDLGWPRLRRAVRRERRNERIQRWSRPVLAVAASLALIVQVGIVSGWLGSEEGSRLAGSPEAHLQIRFESDANEAAIRELLRGIQGSIVEGPGASGLYRVTLAQAPATESEWKALVDTLAARRRVVSFVARE
jgi:hypothetical protein